mgnify:CR=1 FL=1
MLANCVLEVNRCLLIRVEVGRLEVKELHVPKASQHHLREGLVGVPLLHKRKKKKNYEEKNVTTERHHHRIHIPSTHIHVPQC